jgi:hypothetical protein
MSAAKALAAEVVVLLTKVCVKLADTFSTIHNPGERPTHV